MIEAVIVRMNKIRDQHAWRYLPVTIPTCPDGTTEQRPALSERPCSYLLLCVLNEIFAALLNFFFFFDSSKGEDEICGGDD